MKKQSGLIKRERFDFLKILGPALICCLCATAIAAAQSVAIVASTAILSSVFEQAPGADDKEDRLSNETRQELARVRQATLQYHSQGAECVGWCVGAARLDLASESERDLCRQQPGRSLSLNSSKYRLR